jgi:hypothetical protein
VTDPAWASAWGRSSDGQSARLSRERSPVQARSVPPYPLSSAAERRLDKAEAGGSAPPAGTRSLSPTDRQAAYEAADAGSTPAGDAHR